VVVVNEEWREGMGSSLRAALAALEDSQADAVVVSLVDLPGLTAGAVRRLVESSADLAAASYHGERGHPVLFGRSHWGGISGAAHGDAGARDYLRAHAADLALIEVGDIASGDDMDVPRQ